MGLLGVAAFLVAVEVILVELLDVKPLVVVLLVKFLVTAVEHLADLLEDIVVKAVVVELHAAAVASSEM